MSKFKPTLAVEADLERLKFPVYGSPKLDGIRASILNGSMLTRTLKQVPNRHAFNLFSSSAPEGLDGELILGDPTAHDVYLRTNSAVMSHDGTPDLTYWVFDVARECHVDKPYWSRLEWLTTWFKASNWHGNVKLLPQTLLKDQSELDQYENDVVEAGYEGVILRCPQAPYKFGRSTVKEGYLLKLKRMATDEAMVIDVEEEMFNGNEALTNELGRTKRSTAKAGLVPKGRMGKLVVRDLKTSVEFRIGTGFTSKQREDMWKEPPIGKIVSYNHFPVGRKDLPRHPSYKGFRSLIDM